MEKKFISLRPGKLFTKKSMPNIVAMKLRGKYTDCCGNIINCVDIRNAKGYFFKDGARVQVD